MDTSNKLLKLTFLGDIMCDNAMSKELHKYCYPNTDKYSFNSVFRPMKVFLSESDYVMGNLETPISKDKHMLTNKQWEFCTDYEFAKALYDAGIHYVATANNHCLDRGITGLNSTIVCLDEIGLAHSGTYLSSQKRQPLIVNVGNLSVGLLSYTYGTNAFSNKNYLSFKNRRLVDMTQEQESAWERYSPISVFCKRKPHSFFARVRRKLASLVFPQNVNKEWFEKRSFNWYRQFLLKKDIAKLDLLGVDKKIIYLHIGGQYNTSPNNYTMYLTQWLEKKGIDFIIANHEHVIHGSKLTDNCFISYALGNFLSSAGTLHSPFDRRSNYSIAVHAYIDKITKHVDRYSFTVLTTYYTEEGKFEVWPVYDLLEVLPAARAEQMLSEALQCVRDFSGLTIDNLTKEIFLR